MGMNQTPRWGHPYPDGSVRPEIPTHLEALAVSLDGIAKDDQGTIADRANVEQKRGMYYQSNDEPDPADNQKTRRLYRHNGAGFDEIPVLPLTSRMVHSSLKPSGGAPDNAEALRALGLAAGMAMPGTHKPAAIHVISPSDNWGKDSVRNFNATGGRCYAIFAVTGYAVAAQNNYVMRANLWRGVPGNAVSVGVAEHWSYADKEYRWMMGFFDMGVLNGAQSMFWNSIVGGHFDYDGNGRTVLAVFEVK